MSGKKDIVKEVVTGLMRGDLKQRITKMGVDQLLGILISKAPFMSFGPLKGIATFFIKKGVTALMEQTIIGAHVLYIYGDTHFDKLKVQKIIKKMSALEGEMTDEQRQKLDAELASAGRELIHFNIR